MNSPSQPDLSSESDARLWDLSLQRMSFVRGRSSASKKVELDEFHTASRDEQVEMLSSSDLGLIWFHAASLARFFDECLRVEGSTEGVILDGASSVEQVPHH